jgi:hypothetical protein
MTLTKRTKLNLLIGGSVAAGFLLYFFVKQMGPMSTPVHIAVLGAVSIAVIWSSIYSWKLLDEAQREAHKWALYWGSCFGILVGFLLLTLSFRVAPGLVNSIKPHGSPNDFVAVGYGAALLCMVAGYGVAWVVWWLKRR